MPEGHDRYGSGFRQNLDQVARVAANQREGSAVFRNTSGTAQATLQAGTAVGFITAALNGQYGTAASIAGGVGAANIAARAMTSPAVVKWLATSTKAPASALPALLTQAAKSDNSDLRDVAEVVGRQYSKSH